MAEDSKIGWTDHTSAKACATCAEVKPPSAFGRDRSRPDGHTYVCRQCKNRRQRGSYVPHPFGPDRRPGPAPKPPRAGDRKQARQRINVEVRTGRRPHPNTLPCADCGHAWCEGERRHEYDHHLGYAAEHHGDVEAVCTTCHRKRSVDRRELVQTRGERGRYVAQEVM